MCPPPRSSKVYHPPLTHAGPAPLTLPSPPLTISCCNAPHTAPKTRTPHAPRLSNFPGPSCLLILGWCFHPHSSFLPSASALSVVPPHPDPCTFPVRSIPCHRSPTLPPQRASPPSRRPPLVPSPGPDSLPHPAASFHLCVNLTDSNSPPTTPRLTPQHPLFPPASSPSPLFLRHPFPPSFHSHPFPRRSPHPSLTLFSKSFRVLFHLPLPPLCVLSSACSLSSPSPLFPLSPLHFPAPLTPPPSPPLDLSDTLPARSPNLPVSLYVPLPSLVCSPPSCAHPTTCRWPPCSLARSPHPKLARAPPHPPPLPPHAPVPPLRPPPPPFWFPPPSFRFFAPFVCTPSYSHAATLTSSPPLLPRFFFLGRLFFSTPPSFVLFRLADVMIFCSCSIFTCSVMSCHTMFQSAFSIFLSVVVRRPFERAPTLTLASRAVPSRHKYNVLVFSRSSPPFPKSPPAHRLDYCMYSCMTWPFPPPSPPSHPLHRPSSRVPLFPFPQSYPPSLGPFVVWTVCSPAPFCPRAPPAPQCAHSGICLAGRAGLATTPPLSPSLFPPLAFSSMALRTPRCPLSFRLVDLVQCFSA